MQIPLRWRDVLEKRRENEKEEDGPLAQMHARARIIRLTRLEGALQWHKIWRIAGYPYDYGEANTKSERIDHCVTRGRQAALYAE